MMDSVLMLLLSGFAFAGDAGSASLFDLKSQRTQELFKLNIQVEGQSDIMNTTATFTDLQGAVVAKEEAQIRGAQILSYRMKQAQTGELGKFVVQGDKISFEYELNGRRKVSVEKVKGIVLCTANFSAFVRENWDSLMQGKSFQVRFAVWSRLETVGFSLQKVGEVENGKDKWVELKFKPSNFLISALVDPIYLWYSLSDRRLMLMKGRVTPKVRSGNDWRDLDAEAVYTYDQKTVSN